MTDLGQSLDFSISVKKLVTVVLVAGFIGGILVGFTGGFVSGIVVADHTFGDYMASDVQKVGNSEESNSGSDSGTEKVNLTSEGEPVLGDEDAPNTIYVAEDFQCPFCKQFEQNAMQKIIENQVETGEAKIVWKDYPLSQIHPWAEEAAKVTECVYRQDNQAFWNVREKVFENQESFTTDNVETKIKELAAEEGVSGSAISSCLKNGNPGEEVQQDLQEMKDAGVSGTPTVFIGNEKIVGAQPYSRFKSALEDN